MHSAKKDTVILFLPRPLPDAQSLNELPYTLLYLERALRDLGLEILLLDESRQPDYLALLAERGDRVLLAGVSAMTGHGIFGGIAFSKSVHDICHAPVVWGGCHATLLPEQTLQEAYIDYVVVGQGERPLRQLVERLRSGEDISSIAGLGFKRGGAISMNPPPAIMGYDAFPPINLGLLDLSQYLFPADRQVKRCVPYFASHGCPFHCAFCSVAMIYGRHWFHKPITQIIEELRFLKEHFGIDGVQFYDDNLFVNAAFCRELARAMIDADLQLKWRCGAHARLFTEKFTDEDVRLFAEAGCIRIYIGAESGDQEVLDVIDKQSRVEDTFRFIEMLAPHGILPRLSTMVCLPMDPGRDFALTIDMIGRAKLLEPRLETSVSFYTPYPRTGLYEKAKEKGFVPPRCLEDWARHTYYEFKAPWTPRGIRWRLKAFMECYYPMLDHQAYRRFSSRGARMVAYPVNRLLFSIARLRVKKGWYGFPVEAVIFLGARKLHRHCRRAFTGLLPVTWLEAMKATVRVRA